MSPSTKDMKQISEESQEVLVTASHEENIEHGDSFIDRMKLF